MEMEEVEIIGKRIRRIVKVEIVLIYVWIVDWYWLMYRQRILIYSYQV